MAEVENIVLSLIEKEIPEGKKALQDGHENLDKVAVYCQQKYQEANNRYKGAPDKQKVREETREVFEETKQFATQSLASVAYQINTLAVNMLNLFDQQAFQLQTMESRINHISEIVNIHKEKVARREIGVLATSKNTARTHKIIAPAKQEKPERYSRKQVDYSLLDDVGHGVKLSQSDRRQSRTSTKKKQPSPTTTQPSSLRSKPPTRSNIKPPPPPVPPPMPPSLPSGADTYASIGGVDQGIPPPPPPVQSSPVVASSKVVVQPPMAPPPPPMIGGGGTSPPPPPPFPNTNLPPPQGQGEDTYEAVDDVMSPPPPPPPPEDFYNTPSSLPMPLPPEEGWYDTAPPISSPQMPPPPPPMMGGNAPDEYLEKVIALYDYTAMREDELTFTENTVIYVVKKNDDGWFEGVAEESGQTGLFPGNYVQPV